MSTALGYLLILTSCLTELPFLAVLTLSCYDTMYRLSLS